MSMIGSYLLKEEKDIELKQALQYDSFFQGYKKEDFDRMFQILVSSGFLKNQPGERIDMDEIKRIQNSPYKAPLLHINMSGGESVKPGNIILNWKRLVGELPSIVESGIALKSDNTILVCCAALIIWKSVKRIVTIKISKEQSIVLLSLWKYSERQKEITIHKGLEIVNEFCASHGEKTMIPEEYQRILDELVVLKCIDIEEDTIHLREKARHKYR